jgi:hypothetical protein
VSWFSHSGDIGDIIYALPTIKAKGGGKLFLFDFPGRTYQPMTPQRHATLQELLEYQNYIEACEFTTEWVDTSLNGFRDHYRNGTNAAEWHLCTHGLGWEHAIEPWLTVPKPAESPDVVIAWTPRHHSFDFPWSRVATTYKGRIGFVGYEEYWEYFCKHYGEVEYLPADNLMKCAQLIAGSKLYVGNLTSMTAIAEGLKHRMIVEGCHGLPANDFVRHGSIITYSERFELPCLDAA